MNKFFLIITRTFHGICCRIMVNREVSLKYRMEAIGNKSIQSFGRLVRAIIALFAGCKSDVELSFHHFYLYLLQLYCAIFPFSVYLYQISPAVSRYKLTLVVSLSKEEFWYLYSEDHVIQVDAEIVSQIPRIWLSCIGSNMLELLESLMSNRLQLIRRLSKESCSSKLESCYTYLDLRSWNASFLPLFLHLKEFDSFSISVKDVKYQSTLLLVFLGLKISMMLLLLISFGILETLREKYQCTHLSLLTLIFHLLWTYCSPTILEWGSIIPYRPFHAYLNLFLSIAIGGKENGK